MIKKGSAVSDNISNALISELVQDMREPFATFILVADTIRHTQRSLPQEELQILIEEVQRMTLKSAGLLDGLLCWMKSQKEGYMNQKQSLLLYDLICEANSLYEYSQLDKSIVISNAIPADQLVYANKEMLQFINRNILSNATKYSPPGGVINITCSIENDWITVAFTDQGTGIPEDQLDGLFNIHDAKMIDNQRIKSAGIALNICQNMIGQMDGKLWAESVHGKGATFYYSLPFLT